MVYTVKYNQSSVPEVGDTLLVDTVDSGNEKGEMSWARIPQEFSIADDQGDSDVVNLPETVTFLGGTGLTSNIGDNTVTYTLDSSGVTAGEYGSENDIPVLTINSQGQVTNASTQSISSYASVVYGTSLLGYSLTPPEGSYISSSGAEIWGGGLGGSSTSPIVMSSGSFLGPLDGSTVSLLVDSGAVAILSRPI